VELSEPGWFRNMPLEAQVGKTAVTMSYTGAGENFCGFMTLYFKLEDGKSSRWQAGSGMEQLANGPHAGMWEWSIGASFARNVDGDWYCTGLYTGGESLAYPTALSEASVEKLVDYYFHSTGEAREYRLPLELRHRSAQQFSGLNDVLDGYSAGQAKELCEVLGAQMKWYPDYGLSFDDAAGVLIEPYRSYMADAFETAPPIG